MPFEIPSNWVYCKLGEICHIAGRIGFRGYTKADLVHSGGAITLSPSNIIEGQMNYDNCTFITWKKYEESPEIQIQNGDILLVKTGSSYGKCALVQYLPQKATINPQFVTLKYIGCSAKYLTYVLQSAYARKNYENFVLGTAIPTFTQVDLGNMMIPMPPMSEQFRIVTEVKRWFTLIDEIEVNKTYLQKFVKLTKSKVLSLAINGKLVPQDSNDEPAIELLRRINPEFVPCDTSHYANLPQGWCICRIHDVFDVSMGSSPTGDSLNREHKGTEFHQGKICFSDIYLQPSEVYTTMPTKLADAHTILLCVRAPVGVVNITERAICIGRGLCALKPKTDVDLMFAFYAMQTHESNFDKQATGSTFKAISGRIIRDEEFILPPYNEQIRIRQTIENVFSQLDNITAEL